ncbi:MAG: D-alanyl-D-alanine carboxypeptidase, partial [Chloroflexota bacterium]|nr:D-alanyl-D-alanine carboxypeptidase [Chloroflexota bacterium]
MRRIQGAACITAILVAAVTNGSSLAVSSSQRQAAALPAGSEPGKVLSTHRLPAARHRHVVHGRVSTAGHPLSAASTVLAYAPPPIQARAAFLVDMQTGKVLYEKNPDQRLAMASTTKITTAVVALQHARLDSLVRVSHRAATIGESTMVLQEGERLTVRQLLYGLLLNSANDAAITLAEHVAGNEPRFVAMMNELARLLHMHNTHYVTSHGLDAPGHYSSARDLATIAIYAMRDPTFRRIVSTLSYHIPATRHNSEHWLASINRVMYWFPGVDGVKPGQTDNSGLCQVVSAWRNGHHLMAVLLDTPTLVTDIRNLLNYGGRDFQWVQAPAWWDSPANSIAGGSGTHRWLYFLGAGHYLRGLFLDYFNTHGGLRALGYPRTEAIHVANQRVQFFQGGELVYDPVHHTVFPQPVIAMTPSRGAMRTLLFQPRIPLATLFRNLYTELGGAGVMGTPLSGLEWRWGRYLQLYQYGVLMLSDGTAVVMPSGDALLRARGWLPAVGASDVFPLGMSS